MERVVAEREREREAEEREATYSEREAVQVELALCFEHKREIEKIQLQAWLD